MGHNNESYRAREGLWRLKTSWFFAVLRRLVLIYCRVLPSGVSCGGRILCGRWSQWIVSNG